MTAVAKLPEDDDGMPIGYADWYNNRFFGQPVNTARDHDCETAWRAGALHARASAGEGGVLDIEALRSMWRALVDAGGATTIARHGVERGSVEWANTVTYGMLAIERHLHPERFDDFTAAPQPAQAGASGGGGRIKTKGPDDFASHVCPAESAAVWNTCVYEHERIAEGLRPILSSTEVTPASPATGEEWRCFHCDEAFTDREAATAHFGTHEYQRPACLIDAAEYRRMEAQEARYAEEDADCHRAMHRQASEHQVALRRAEEAGYAKGLRDSGKCPCATPPAHGDGEGDARAEFERWVAKRWGYSTERWADSGEYLYQNTRDWWQCWQAALTTRPTPEAQEARDAALLAKWIIRHRDDFPSWITVDHACAQCVPDGDLLMPGFVCAYHIAERIDAALALPAQGEGKV